MIECFFKDFLVVVGGALDVSSMFYDVVDEADDCTDFCPVKLSAFCALEAFSGDAHVGEVVKAVVFVSVVWVVFSHVIFTCRVIVLVSSLLSVGCFLVSPS